MFNKVKIVLRTLSNLKLVQIIYQLKYRFGINRHLSQGVNLKSKHTKLHSFDYLESLSSFNKEPYQFEFLNQSVTFENEIKWNYNDNGKLWNYNLNYFDFIVKPELNHEHVVKIIESYYKNYPTIVDGKEPYPTSLRIMNLVKLKGHYQDERLDFILKNDIQRLFQSLEFHLLGNHLLENAFALYYAAHLYPTEKKLVNKAMKLLKEQLDEQILKDGAHYERSFMYHQIILGRLLESISISEANPYDWNKNILGLLRKKAELMLSWMITISYGGKIFPRFNDSIEGVSHGTSELIELSKKLNLFPIEYINLSDSGYRVLIENDFQITANIGSITPTYQPGHSHADSLSFTFHVNDKPIIVDPGISTYENSYTRKRQRSTFMHNTVSIADKNNNEVWSKFRVGRMAKVAIIKNCKYIVEASHTGYKHIKSYHRRRWEVKKDIILISDKIHTPKSIVAKLCLHFHPKCEIRHEEENKIIVNEKIQIVINKDSYSRIDLVNYDYAHGFNNTERASKIIVEIRKSIVETLISKYENPCN